MHNYLSCTSTYGSSPAIRTPVRQASGQWQSNTRRKMCGKGANALRVRHGGGDGGRWSLRPNRGRGRGVSMAAARHTSRKAKSTTSPAGQWTLRVDGTSRPVDAVLALEGYLRSTCRQKATYLPPSRTPPFGPSHTLVQAQPYQAPITP